MSIKIFITLVLFSVVSVAQVPPPPQTAPSPGTPPAPAATAPSGNPAAPPPANAPPPQNVAAPLPQNPPPAAPQNTAPSGNPPPSVMTELTPPAGIPPAAPVLVPVNPNPVLPSLVNPGADKTKGGKDADKDANKPSIKEIEMNTSLRNKSPFMIPTDLYLKIKRRQGEKVVENVTDDSVSPKIRWPLRSYALIGVLGGVKVPKALIRDREGKIHTFRSKELIANSGGYISEIGNGEVIVVERGAEVKLSLKKDTKN